MMRTVILCSLLAKKCINANIFPLIGALELAGKATERYEEIVPKTEKLLAAKSLIDQMFFGRYRIPICPSTIGAIHIAANGDIVVDAMSGLSCSWFWLKTPNTISVGNINQGFDYCEIVNKIIAYRKKVFYNLSSMENTLSDSPFGGCGGCTGC